MKIATYGTNHFVRYSRHVRYLGCPLLGGFIVFAKFVLSIIFHTSPKIQNEKPFFHEIILKLLKVGSNLLEQINQFLNVFIRHFQYPLMRSRKKRSKKNE